MLPVKFLYADNIVEQLQYVVFRFLQIVLA